MGTEKCCHNPGKSINLRSTILAPFSLAIFSTSFGVIPYSSPTIAVLNSLFASFSRADPYGILDREHEDFSIPNSTSLGRRDNRFDDGVRHLVGGDDLNLDFGEEIDHILRSPIELGMPLLSAKSLDFRYRHPLDADLAQPITDLIKLERLNDGF